MSSVTKAVRYHLAITMIIMGGAIEFSGLPKTSTGTSVDSIEVASRYQLRNRTPNFFSRSKTSTSAPAPKAPPQPVRRG